MLFFLFIFYKNKILLLLSILNTHLIYMRLIISTDGWCMSVRLHLKKVYISQFAKIIIFNKKNKYPP